MMSTELVGQPLDGAFIGACTTTEEELALAALVLEAALADGHAPQETPAGRRIVVPGDLLDSEAFWRRRASGTIYEHAGFTVDPPNCSMCLGIASRKAGKGEVWLSSQNRNFENRMGEGSLAWLASAATVAASALAMTVADPRPLLARVDRDRLARILGRKETRALPEITTAEPTMHVEPRGDGKTAQRGAVRTIRGRVQRFGDSVDTDAIIPGEFCHLTKLEELGDKALLLRAAGVPRAGACGRDDRRRR